MYLVDYKRTINMTNVDTQKNDLDIEKWTANENNIYGYVCKDKKGNVIGTKYFMEHVNIREVTFSFRKDIRAKNIKLAA
jgi:hypothetical protein